MTTHYFIFAGEKSGDLHGGRLMRALTAAHSTPPAFTGVGGSTMREFGLEGVLRMEDFQVMGFSDVLTSLPKLFKQFYQVLNQILKTNPDCVVLIDYPGFNLRLSRALRKRGFSGKIVQYICPTVWAHGRSRVATMSENLDLLLTIYPFESQFFTGASLPVYYIGNPLVEGIYRHAYVQDWKMKTGIPSNDPLIALFPGSRLNEIERNLPQQLEAIQLLRRDHPSLSFALSYAQDSLLPSIQKILSRSNLTLNKDIFLTPSCYSYELMRDCHTALAKSGTVTLELALHDRPTLVSYQASSFNYFVAKYLLKLNLPYYCIVNILNQKKIFPELIGKKISGQALYEELKLLYQDEGIRQAMIKGCQETRKSLGKKESNLLAATRILELLEC